MHSSALLRLVAGSSALLVGVQAQQSSELPIPSSVLPSSVAPSSEPASSAAPSSEPASSESPSVSVSISAIVTDTTTITDTVTPPWPTSHHPEPTLTHYSTIEKCQKYHGKDCYPGQVHTKHYKPKEYYYEWCTTYVSYDHGVATTCTDTYTRTTWYDQEKTTVKHYKEKQTYYETQGDATITLTKEKPTKTLVPIYPTVTVPAETKPPVTVVPKPGPAETVTGPAPHNPDVTVVPEPVPGKTVVGPAPHNPDVTVVPVPEPGKTVTGEKPVNPPVTVIPEPAPVPTVTGEKPVQPPATVVPEPVPEPETSHVIVSGQPSLRDAGFLPMLIALGALPVGMAILM